MSCQRKTNLVFFVTVYRDVLLDGVWPVVGYRKFESKEEAWPPPRGAVDAITRIGSLYDKGELKPCSYEECKDLEIAAVWERWHVVSRLMGGDEWKKWLIWPIDPSKK